jgi:hypothetical protein
MLRPRAQLPTQSSRLRGLPITTSSAGGTASTSDTKPKSRATTPTSVMHLRLSIVVRPPRVGLCESVSSGAVMAAWKTDIKPVCTAVSGVYRPSWNTRKRGEHGSRYFRPTSHEPAEPCSYEPCIILLLLDRRLKSPLPVPEQAKGSNILLPAKSWQ